MNFIEVTLPNGYIVQAIDQSKTIIDEIWFNNTYDRHCTIHRGIKIIDLGANLGFFSLYAASKEATVYGFEPEKQNYSIYKCSIEKNNFQQQITSFNLTVAKDKKRIEIFLNDFNEQFISGMVTTSLNLLKKYNKNKYTKQVVPCIGKKRCYCTGD